MSYYKITHESDTIEGLKAIQGSSFGHGASATNSSNPENSVPPPLPQDEKNADAFSSIVQAPPPTADSTGTGLDFSDENAIQSPPPTSADMATVNSDSEGEIPPPPTD